MEFVICHNDGSLPSSENIYTGVEKERLPLDMLKTTYKIKKRKKKKVIKHSGIDGMEKGVRHGPPYPIDDATRAEMARQAAAKRKEHKEHKEAIKQAQKLFNNKDDIKNINSAADYLSDPFRDDTSFFGKIRLKQSTIAMDYAIKKIENIADPDNEFADNFQKIPITNTLRKLKATKEYMHDMFDAIADSHALANLSTNSLNFMMEHTVRPYLYEISEINGEDLQKNEELDTFWSELYFLTDYNNITEGIHY